MYSILHLAEKEENAIQQSLPTDESKASTTSATTTTPATTTTSTTQSTSVDADDAYLATSADVTSLCTQQEYEILKVNKY